MSADGDPGAPPRFRLPTRSTLSWIMAFGSLAGGILAVLATYTAWVTRGANDASSSRYASEHAAAFEASVDKRLVDAVARMDATDRDRDARTAASQARVDGLAVTLHGRIDEVIKREDARNEVRNDVMNAMGLRVTGLEIKLCVLGGVRISGCK